MATEMVTIPDVLGVGKRSVETLYEKTVAAVPPVDTYVFDMYNVRFVCPYGIIALVCASRLLAERSGRVVQLARMKTDVHQYLERMDLFLVGERWLEPTTVLTEKWSRNEASDRLLELTTIRNSDDVLVIADRARRIFARWLVAADQHRLVNVLSELCGNVYQHSGDDKACAVIQRHCYRTGVAVVRLSVGDLGRGIRGTLQPVYPDLGETSLDFVEAALQGYSSRCRDGERGGLGLRSVEEIALTRGGRLWIRSEEAGVLSHQRYPILLGDLTYVQGTQLAVDLRLNSGA
jgi:signal transduction histidine kinase